MTDTLDEKLQAIRIDWGAQDVPLGANAINEIKQAFTDADYVYLPDPPILLTGKEWHDRFLYQLDQGYRNHAKDKPYWVALDSAKRAAGIADE